MGMGMGMGMEREREREETRFTPLLRKNNLTDGGMKKTFIFSFWCYENNTKPYIKISFTK